MPPNKSRSSKKSKKAKAKAKKPSISKLDNSNSTPTPMDVDVDMDVDMTPVASGSGNANSSHSTLLPTTEKLKLPEPTAKTALNAEVAGTSGLARMSMLDKIIIPNPSLNLRRLPCTPRFAPLPVLEPEPEQVAVIKEEVNYDDDDYYYYTSDSEEEEREEDRTIHAVLAPRMRSYERMEKTMGDFLTIMYHTLEGHQRLLNDCGHLLRHVIPYNLKCYYRLPDKRVVGVVVDHDMYPQLGSQREKELEALRLWEKSRLAGSMPSTSGR